MSYRIPSKNDHAVVTIMSLLLLLPLVHFYEGKEKIEQVCRLVLLPIISFSSSFNTIFLQAYFALGGRQTEFMFNALVCGMCWYLYNEVCMMILSKTVSLFLFLFLFLSLSHQIQNIILGSLGPVPTAVGNIPFDTSIKTSVPLTSYVYFF